MPDEGIREGNAFVRDHIPFTCGGRQWRLRRLYAIGERLVSAPQGFRLKAGDPGISFADSPHAALETEAELSLRPDLDSVATDLCWILQMARGSQLRWTEVRVEEGTTTQFLQSRPNSRLPIWDGGSPIKNSSDGALRIFLESAWPIFQAQRDWWRITSDWFAWAHATATIEVSGLICSMLLERTTEFIVCEMNLPRQIDPALDPVLAVDTPARAALATEMTALWRRYSTLWPDQQSQSLINTVQQWNNSPSYQNQIRLAFQRYHLEPPPSSLLANRHSLAHDGMLSSRTQDPGRYLSDIIGTVVGLILRMLNYSGNYFVLGRGEATLPPLPVS